MGLGVLKDRVMDHVPGTTRYFDDPARPQFARDGVTHLKCDTSGPQPIILVPQPSDDPNDPLNWPLWKRDFITLILSATAIFATALGPILAANTFTLSLYFRRDFTEIALLTGYFLLGTGVGAIFFVPSARLFGKRHAFILGAFILVWSTAWGGASGTNYTSLLWARIFQGIGCSPYESLINAAVGDLYFVHERGKRMAFTNLAVFGGSFFTPILVGKITHTLGWQWTFYLETIFCALCLPAVIFLCPETAYRRDTSLNIDMQATSASNQQDSQDEERTVIGDHTRQASDGSNKEAGISAQQRAISSSPPPAKVSWVQTLAPFNGRKTDENFLKLLLRPFPLYLQPAFLWGTLIQGTMIGWTVFIGVIMAAFMLGPPLWWGEVETGYAYVGAFVGAILGFIIAGGLADWSAKLLTRWNGGVYEPEFRLVLMIPQTIIGCMGLYGWGFSADKLLRDYDKTFYPVPLTFFGLVVAGMVIGTVSASLYLVDAYRDLAVEGFTCMIIFKNFFSFALTFKAYEWLIEQPGVHAAPLFVKLGSMQLAICLLSVPIYIFGKRIRSFFYRHDILALFKVR